MKAKRQNLKTVINKLRQLRAHSRKIADAKPNIRISSNRDRLATQASRLGMVIAYDMALRMLKEVA